MHVHPRVLLAGADADAAQSTVAAPLAASRSLALMLRPALSLSGQGNVSNPQSRRSYEDLQWLR